MNAEKLARLNELAQKSRLPDGLTEAERLEQKALREEYIAGFRNSLIGQLENTYVLETDGTKRKLTQKEDS